MAYESGVVGRVYNRNSDNLEMMVFGILIPPMANREEDSQQDITINIHAAQPRKERDED